LDGRAYLSRCVKELLRVIGLPAGIPAGSGGRTDHECCDQGELGGGAVLDGGGVVPESARVPLRELMDDRLLDALLERSRDQAGGLRLTGEGSMLGELVRAVLERALESELTAHLGYERHEAGRGAGNARNGTIAKTVQTGVGPVPLPCPRPSPGTEPRSARHDGPKRLIRIIGWSSRYRRRAGPVSSPAVQMSVRSWYDGLR